MFGRAIVKAIIVSVNVLLAGILLLSLMGAFISPEIVILPAYFALGFPFVVLINIGFVFFWLIVRRWWFLLSFVLLLAAGTQIKDTFPLNFTNQSSAVINKNSISILTYNTFMSGKLKKHTPQNPNMVVQSILETDADIVCLQEFTVSKNPEYLTEADLIKIFSKYRYKHIEYQLEKSSKRVGIATFSKYPIINRHKIAYDSYANLSIYTDIILRGKRVRFINNHLESNRLTEKDKNMPILLKEKLNADNISKTTRYFSRKLGQAYKVRANQSDMVAKVIENSPHSVICCGDFNDVPASYAYTRIKGDLTDAFSECGNGFGWTFHDRFYRFRIDYVLYDATAFSLIDFKLIDVDYSDHYPILCRLNIN